MAKAQLFSRELFVDDRGHFTNIPINLPELYFKGKRVYVCDNFQAGTVRGYHHHKHESKVFICLKGGIKFVLLPGDMMVSAHPLSWEPEKFTLSGSIPKALYVPKDYANAWQTLTDDTIMIGVSDVTVEESMADDTRLDPTIHNSAYWETKWR